MCRIKRRWPQSECCIYPGERQPRGAAPSPRSSTLVLQLEKPFAAGTPLPRKNLNPGG